MFLNVRPTFLDVRSTHRHRRSTRSDRSSMITNQHPTGRDVRSLLPRFPASLVLMESIEPLASQSKQ